MKKYYLISLIAICAIFVLACASMNWRHSKYIHDVSQKIEKALDLAVEGELMEKINNIHLNDLEGPRIGVRLHRVSQQVLDSIMNLPEVKDGTYKVDILDAREEYAAGMPEIEITQLHYQDRYIKHGVYINLPVLDSIFRYRLQEVIPHKFTLLVNDLPLDTFGDERIRYVNYSYQKRAGLKESQNLLLDAQIPVVVFLKEEVVPLLLITLMMLVALGCLLFQLTVIRRKEEELKWRDDATRDIIHDLKNPLTTAMTIAEGMKALNDDAVLHETMDYNYNKFNHVLQQVEELKDAISENRPKDKLQTQQVDLLKLAQRVKEECDLLFADKEHSIEIVNKLPEGYRIKANPVMVERIMRNLVENGLKYAEHGVRVEVRLNQTEKGALVEVEDNGWGIAPEYQKKIFKLYYRIPLEGDYRRRGTGVGLASAKTAVRLHRGKIWMKSELGKGSTFSFSLPQE